VVTGRELFQRGFPRIEAENLLARHADLCDYDPAEFQQEADRLAS
jgi:hypothetical protein